MSLDQIGQKLKSSREAQGLSLKQIYEKTKIPIGHLMSIDAAQPDELPEPVYVAGYIKRYADCVGLDGQAMSEEYRRSCEAHNNEALQPAQRNDYIASTPEYFQRGTRLDKPPPTFKTLYFNAFWIVVVIAITCYLVKVQLNNQMNQVDPSVLALKESTLKNQPIATPAAISTSQEPAVTPTETAKDCRLSLSANQHVWLEVKAVSTGESLFTGYLEQGDRRDFQDSQGLTVRAGNGGSLTVDYHGKIESFGEAGKIAERTFTISQTALMPEGEKNINKADSQTPSLTSQAGVSKTIHENHWSATHEKHKRREETFRRREIPDEGGRQAIDVPYRYSE